MKIVALWGLGAILAAAVAGTGEAAAPVHVLVLEYADFGPPSLASGLLGPEWYQWESEGGPDSNARFDARVAVYRDISSKEVRRLHPVDRKHSIDFRCVRYDKAIAWLDSRLAELRRDRAADPMVFDPLIRLLEITRSRIEKSLAPSGEQKSGSGDKE